jgi:hypothetical protein
MIKSNKDSELPIQVDWRSVSIGNSCINRFEGKKPFKIKAAESENDNTSENSNHHAKKIQKSNFSIYFLL